MVDATKEAQRDQRIIDLEAYVATLEAKLAAAQLADMGMPL